MITSRRARAASLVLASTGVILLPGAAPAGFTDQTSSSGLLWYQTSWGAAFVDMDRDGSLDLYTGHHFFDPVLYWNGGAGTFSSTTHPQPWVGPVDRHGALLVPLAFDDYPDIFILHGGHGGAGTEASELYRNDGNGNIYSLIGAGGMDDPGGRSRTASAADYDGDLLLDVWVGKAPDAVDRNSLFRNVGLYDFVDVAPSVGLDEADGTVGGIWGDYDDDGDPDIFVGGEEFPRPSALYRNDAGSFVDVTAIFNPPLPVVSGADWGDVDGDGDLDLAVCDGQIGIFDTFSEGDSVTYFFNTRYAENGVDGLTIPSTADTMLGQFRLRGFLDFDLVFLGPEEFNPDPAFWLELTDEYVGEPGFQAGVDQGTWVWRQFPGGPWEVRCSTPNINYDTFDGILKDFTTITGVVAHDLEDPGFVPGGPKVWRNDGGAFEEITARLGLPATMLNPRDISWVDYDNDGDLDLHVVDMGTSASPNAPDGLFRNDGDVFTDVTVAESLAGGTAGMGDGAAWGDVDRDGDLDVFIAQGAGPITFSAFGPALFCRNDGSGAPSVQLDLVGRQSGAAAIGTKVTARVGTRTIVRWLTANAWRGFGDPREIHIGLGTAALVDTLTIEWPIGTVEVYTSVLPGFYRLREGQRVLDAVGLLPSEIGWRIAGVRPQPARGAQSILLTTAAPLELEVSVHDVAGRLVQWLHRGALAPGTHPLEWNGRDVSGRRVSSGVYFIRATDGRSRTSERSVRIR